MPYKIHFAGMSWVPYFSAKFIHNYLKFTHTYQGIVLVRGVWLSLLIGADQFGSSLKDLHNWLFVINRSFLTFWYMFL